MLPNFLICGTVAGGTSFLSASLIQHPEIYLPKVMRPEPGYFYYSHKYSNGLEWYKEKWFMDIKNEKAVGERSSQYIFGKETPQRIFNVLPDIKLIFTLRNPIERAYANYRFTVLEGLEELSFEEAIELEDHRTNSLEGFWAEVMPFSNIRRGLYYEQLMNYLELFKPENILIIKSENLSKYTDRELRKTFDFLGVDNSFQPKLPPNYSSLGVVDRSTQVKLRGCFGDRFPQIVESVREEWDASPLFNTETDLEHYKILKSNLRDKKDQINDDTRVRLLNIYQEPNQKLKKIIDFDIDDWR